MDAVRNLEVTLRWGKQGENAGYDLINISQFCSTEDYYRTTLRKSN